MILAAHQPHYLPWLGFLDKMARADVFVVMDDLQYETQNFQNRNRIKLAHGSAWLTVPLEKGAQTDRICDKRIQNGGSAREHWQRKTWETLKINYGKAPWFAAYAPALQALFTQPFERLLDVQLAVLALVRGWFEITQPLVHSSSLALVGSKTDRIIDMCRKLGARTYLSGRGGSTGYLDVEALARAGVAVAWQDFCHPSYPQRYPGQGFVSHLAFLDLVLNCGPDSRAVLWPEALRRVAG